MRTLHGYGLTLRQLQHQDIEMVRQWRNDPRVSAYMAFRGQISTEQQEVWFKSIDNEQNHFFVIDLAGEPVGLCELKKHDRTARSAEGGIFIHNEQFRTSPYCVAAALLLNDFGFERLRLERIYAQILDENTRAIRFNKMLGYELLEPTYSGKSIYFLTKEAFRRASSNIRRGLEKILPGNEVVPITNSSRR
jgi:RimJ/RimL family protein N-acetyltransferase